MKVFYDGKGPLKNDVNGGRGGSTWISDKKWEWGENGVRKKRCHHTNI